MMDKTLAALAQECLFATHDGSLSFPAIIGKLMAAGFEGYAVDYRRGSQTFYLPDGDFLDLGLPCYTRPVADHFDVACVKALISWAQSGDPAYTYLAFSQKVTSAGCAGYLVSFLGSRVVYYARSGETHIELFPQ